MATSLEDDKEFKHMYLAFARSRMISIGTWPLEISGWRKIFYDVLYYSIYSLCLTTFMFQFYETLTILRKGALEDAGDLAIKITFLLVLVKISICRTKYIPGLVAEIESKEKAILNESDEVIKKMYTDTSVSTATLAKIYVLMAKVTFICYNVSPLVLNWFRPLPYNNATGIEEKRLPYSSWYPFDQNQHYYLVYVTQFVCFHFGYTSFVACDVFFVSIFVFLATRIKILQRLFKKFTFYYKRYSRKHNLPEETAQIMFLRECIKEHEEIIRLVAKINDILYTMNVMNFLISSFVLSLVVFEVIGSTTSYTENMSQILYFVTFSVHLVMYYWYAHEITTQAEAIGDAVYSSEWYTYTTELRKMMVLVTLRSQRPLEFTIGPTYPMRVTVLVQIYKAFYSYVALFNN